MLTVSAFSRSLGKVAPRLALSLFTIVEYSISATALFSSTTSLGSPKPSTNSPFRSVPRKSFEEYAASDDLRLGKTPRLDPDSAEYLARVTPQAAETTKSISGTTVRLMNQLSIAETPDYDPFQDLGKINLTWRQTHGIAVELLDANSSRARAVMPDVSAPSHLVFTLEATNASGQRRVELTVTVLPRATK